MSDHKLWYTRRGEVVRGPFPSGQIRRFLLLGRIQPGDELSVDQRSWSPAHTHADLYPEELNADPGDAAAMERLRLARMRADERIRERRQEPRHESGNAAPRSDRRQAEDAATLASREQRERVILRPAVVNNRVRMAALLAGSLFCAVLALAFFLAPQTDSLNLQCVQAPGPGVNWSNCRKSEQDLNGVDLTHAQIVNTYFDRSRLRNADLSFSNLDYSNFVAADLSGARLDHASLKGAVLRQARLEQTSLFAAHLPYAIFQDAVLQEVNLENADLRNADFNAAQLRAVNLRGADLSGAVWIDGTHCQTPSLGECRP